MYSADHSILQLSNVVSSLEREEKRAKEWIENESNDGMVYKTKYLTPNTISYIEKFIGTAI